MGLISNLKQNIDDNDNKVEEYTINNIKDSLSVASAKLLMKIQSNEIDLDVKDLKDLASVYTQLTQDTNTQSGEATTPEAPKMVSQSYQNSGILPIHKEADDTLVINQEDIEELSSEDIDKLVQDQFIAQNDSNVKENIG